MRVLNIFTLCALILLVNTASVAACDAEALGTSRTITLKREAALYGALQHQALPLLKNEVVLTFDDGPSPENTPLALKALADHCSKASFFLIGQQLELHPELAKRLVKEGHTTALHSYHHRHLATLSVSEQLADLHKSLDIYQQIFKTSTPAYRFPFLEETPTMLAALKAKNITVASIDLTIDDWRAEDTTEVLVQRLSDNLDKTGGGIILLHDAHTPTAKALPDLLKLLKRKGYKLVHLEWEK